MSGSSWSMTIIVEGHGLFAASAARDGTPAEGSPVHGSAAAVLATVNKWLSGPPVDDYAITVTLEQGMPEEVQLLARWLAKVLVSDRNVRDRRLLRLRARK